MIAQAESIPVHLGAMPDAVAACLTLDPAPGDVLILNDPFTGGTHLPDITLVTLVEGLGILVSRAHHADVGGMRPGSLPAGATELLQEGLVIPPMRLTDEVMTGDRSQHPAAGRANRRPACADSRATRSASGGCRRARDGWAAGA